MDPKSQKKLHKVSAFAAYNGLDKSEPSKPKSTSTPAVQQEKRNKKRRRKDHVQQNRTQVISPNSVEQRGYESDNDDDDEFEEEQQQSEDDDLEILEVEDDEDEEDIPVLIPIEEERPSEKPKSKKRKHADVQSKSTTMAAASSSAPSSRRISATDAKSLRLRNGHQTKVVSPKMANSDPSSVARNLFGGHLYDEEEPNSIGVHTLLNKLTYANSTKDARAAFAWLIDPIPIAEFFDSYWEKQPLCVQRADRHYYDGLFSTEMLDKFLRQHDIQYTVNLDITKYQKGERTTLNPNGRAYASTVWDFYKDGCSIRMLNPQTYSDAAWKLNSTLQEFFGTFVGANVYLTPAKTQGFAPHYDDIEAFVVQLEGVKRWKVYYPMNDEEMLPRFSSRNYKPEEMGKPMLEVELRPGDLLYFPRGFIHEAVASKDEHSLHMTISTTQRNTYGDLLQIMMDQAVQTAMADDIEFRRALPLNYSDIAGTVHMDRRKNGRKDFVKKVKELMTKLTEFASASIDESVDHMVKEKFMQDCLPPCLTEDEKRRSIHGRPKESSIIFKENTKIRLIRKQCIRLVMEKESDVAIYFNSENSRVYREKELQKFNIDVDLAPGVDFLVEAYPRYVSVVELPIDKPLDKIRLCQLFYEKALLMTEKA